MSTIVVIAVCFQNNITPKIQTLFNMMHDVNFFHESIYMEGRFTDHFLNRMTLRASRMCS